MSPALNKCVQQPQAIYVVGNFEYKSLGMYNKAAALMMILIIKPFNTSLCMAVTPIFLSCLISNRKNSRNCIS